MTEPAHTSIAYRAVIADDERIARVGLRAMLAGHREIRVVGEAASGVDAEAAVQFLRPDILFLDVRMPDRDGFTLLKRLAPNDRPAIVFVTAHREYALDAFGFSAVDYLLKPFSHERLALTVRRVIRFLRGAEKEDPAGQALAGARHAGQTRRLVVHKDGRILFVAPADVRWFEVFGNYLRLAVGERFLLLRSTLGTIGAQLDPASFVRISRSVIVNLQHVESVRCHANGQYELLIGGGARLRSSRRYRRDVRRALVE
jgi:two-component system, LytTR family, response regulator